MECRERSAGKGRDNLPTNQRKRDDKIRYLSNADLNATSNSTAGRRADEVIA
jgi:hypothetical protein